MLTIDPTYFRLTGGIERWLYRLVRKHGGRQEHGWQFDFQHLYRKSGSVARFDFARPARWWRGSRCPATSWASSGCLARNRTADLPARAAHGTGITAGKPVNSLVLSGNRRLVLSGNKSSCYQGNKIGRKPLPALGFVAL